MRLVYGLVAISALALGSMVASLPSQPPIHLPSLDKTLTSPLVNHLRVRTSEVVRGNDMYEVIQALADQIDHGLPQDWERLLQPPSTNGTSAIDTIESLALDLRTIAQGWGVDGELLDQVANNIQALIEVAVAETLYVAQQFTYGTPNCNAGERPSCLTTLMALVRPSLTIDGKVLPAELVHIYMRSEASTLQQTETFRDCQACRVFGICCREEARPRELTPREQVHIQQVLSTNQAAWARSHLPVRASNYGHSSSLQQEVSGCGDKDEPYDGTTRWLIPIIDGLLRKFVQNNHENRDVFKKQESRLLAALQDDMRSRRQNIKKMSVSVNEKGAVPLLENMVADCLDKAGVEEPIADWFKRVREKNPGQTISLECSVSSQRKEVIDPPTDGCRSSTEITSKTLFSWVILFPRNTLIDTLFIQSDLDVTHVECEPLPPSDDPEHGHGCVEGIDVTPSEQPEESGGAIVRWSIMHPDGSFNPVHYTKEWLEYSYLVNKAMLDILRYSAAASYLRVPIPPSMYQLQDRESYYNIEG